MRARWLAVSGLMVGMGLTAGAEERPVTATAEPTPKGGQEAKAMVALPLPSPSGKPIAAAPGQRVFRVPMGFARVERFYRQQLGAAPRVTITVEPGASGRTLTLTSRRGTDSWSRAVVRESAVDTTIEVTPIIRIGTDVVEGRPAQPLVHFVMPPSPEVARQANSIDHLEPPRK